MDNMPVHASILYLYHHDTSVTFRLLSKLASVFKNEESKKMSALSNAEIDGFNQNC
jgi:hypothetical protein